MNYWYLFLVLIGVKLVSTLIIDNIGTIYTFVKALIEFKNEK